MLSLSIGFHPRFGLFGRMMMMTMRRQNKDLSRPKNGGACCARRRPRYTKSLSAAITSYIFYPPPLLLLTRLYSRYCADCIVQMFKSAESYVPKCPDCMIERGNEAEERRIAERCGVQKEASKLLDPFFINQVYSIQWGCY